MADVDPSRGRRGPKSWPMWAMSWPMRILTDADPTRGPCGPKSWRMWTQVLADADQVLADVAPNPGACGPTNPGGCGPESWRMWTRVVADVHPSAWMQLTQSRFHSQYTAQNADVLRHLPMTSLSQLGTASSSGGSSGGSNMGTHTRQEGASGRAASSSISSPAWGPAAARRAHAGRHLLYEDRKLRMTTWEQVHPSPRPVYCACSA